jgi:hypothetical protein
MYLLKLIKAQKVHFFYTLFLAGAAPAHQKNNISKKSNMILKSLIYTDWKRFLIIMT